MTCGEILTRNVVCRVPEDMLEHAAILMKTENIDHHRPGRSLSKVGEEVKQ